MYALFRLNLIRAYSKQRSFGHNLRGMKMTYTSDMVAELNLLLKFPSKSLMQGLKIHHDAEPTLVAAAQRLFDKGIVTLPDGGYLTDLGHDLFEHAQVVQMALAHK